MSMRAFLAVTSMGALVSGCALTVRTPGAGQSAALTSPFALRLSGASEIYAATCARFTVTLTDSGAGSPTTSSNDIVLDLADGGGGSFFSTDQDCSSPVGSLTIPAGQLLASFYYKNPGPSGTHVTLDLADSAGQLDPVSTNLSVISAGGLPGSADTSFGTSGVATLDINGGSVDGALNMAVQEDGKIVVVGNDGTHTALARFDLDGTPDSTFGVGGKIVQDFGGTSDNAQDVAIQPDGKILVAGSADFADSDCYLARFNSDGSLDSGFGTGGWVTLDLSTDDSCEAMALQADGKIVVAGYVYNGTDYDFMAARFSADGTLDPSFATSGTTTFDFSSTDDQVERMEIDPNGKILLAGGTDDFRVAILNPDGTLDTSFGGTGKVSTDIAFSDRAHGIHRLPDGKVLVAGYSGSKADIQVNRYLADGTLDPTFDGDGKLTLDPGGQADWGRSLLVQPDGKILVAGVTTVGGVQAFSLYRLNADGTLDTAFATNGLYRSGVPSGSEPQIAKLQSDGRILLAGKIGNDFGVIRLWP